jgi:hypothetical protein
MGGPDDYGGAVAAAKAKHSPHTLVLEHVAPATRLLEKRRQMFEVGPPTQNFASKCP